MSEKSSLGFKFSFHQRLHLSVYLFFILLICAFISTIAVKVIKDRRERASLEQIMPKVNYEQWQKDLLLFNDKTGRFPKDFRELEILLWNKNDASKPSVLKNGNNTFLINNVIYLYYPSSDGLVCSLWAVPTGQYRKESPTFFMLLTPKSYQIWKGLALEDSDIDRIPKKGIPLDTELARLGMSKQINEEIKDKTSKILSPFGKR